MIGDHGDAFADRNVFLHLALGLLRASRRVDRVLAEYGKRAAVTIEDSPTCDQRARTREEEQLLDFVLGVVSFRNNLVRTLDAARAASRPRRAPARSGGPAEGSLLR